MTLPNQLTTLRILLTPVFVWLILSDAPHLRIWGIVVFVVASLTDLYDGYHARKYGQTTRWGAFMDPLADKILITSAFIYFVHLGLLSLWMVIVCCDSRCDGYATSPLCRVEREARDYK
jgi:CDP-diacylglycerol--glycerol-3-phosphate 3-phosphatidyltransferase